MRRARRRKKNSIFNSLPLIAFSFCLVFSLMTLGLQNPLTEEVIAAPGQIPKEISRAAVEAVTQATGKPELQPIKLTVNEYDVRPADTVDGIRQNLDTAAGRPQDPYSGRSFDGFTRWLVSWEFDEKTEGGECVATQFSFTGTATINMPRITRPESVPVGVLNRWNEYVKNLRLHEDGHVANGQGALDAVRTAAASQVLRAAECGQALSVAISNVMGSIVSEWAKKDQDYDRVTEHGATQGARFP